MADAIKRTILVTGGSRGIGRGICMAFAHADNHIYFNYSSDDEAADQTEKLVADLTRELDSPWSARKKNCMPGSLSRFLSRSGSTKRSRRSWRLGARRSIG